MIFFKISVPYLMYYKAAFEAAFFYGNLLDVHDE